MNISNWSWNLGRAPEACSFLMLADDPHCVICGKRCVPSMKQWHAGPVITVDGWLETDEKHDILADVWRGLKLPTRDGQTVPGILIHVTDRTMPIACNADSKGKTTYRYAFAGSIFVGANQDMPG